MLLKNRLLKNILISLSIIFLTPCFCAAEEIKTDRSHAPEVFSSMLDLSATSAVLTEAHRGQVLFEKNADEKLHISIANKIMTALVVIENMNLQSTVTISKESVSSEGSVLFLIPGEKYLVEDLLYAIMLRSYNDAARALAENAGGSMENFVSKMNSKARELNLKNTLFKNPSGLYNEEQYTTAYDLSVLIRYAINIPAFNDIFSSRTKIWNGLNGLEIMTNQNALFWEYDGVDGGKTGFNEKDKHAAVTTATQGSQKLIAVVVETPASSVFNDSAALLDFGFNNYKYDVLISKNMPLKSIMIGEEKVTLVSINNIFYTHPSGEDYLKEITYSTVPDLVLPIDKNQSAGSAKITLKDNTVIEFMIFPDKDIPLPEDFSSFARKKITEYRDLLYLLIFLAAVEIILIIYKLFLFFRNFLRRIFIRRENA